MTRIHVTYEPYFDAIEVTNITVGGRDPEEEVDFDETVFVAGPDRGEGEKVLEDWTIAFTSRSLSGTRYFYSMCAIGLLRKAAGWNQFLSLYVPDEVVARIYDRVEQWRSVPRNDDLYDEMFTTYQASFIVDDECIVTLHDCFD